MLKGPRCHAEPRECAFALSASTPFIYFSIFPIPSVEADMLPKFVDHLQAVAPIKSALQTHAAARTNKWKVCADSRGASGGGYGQVLAKFG